jgi:hypothetical protein
MMKQAAEQSENQETDQRRSDDGRPDSLGATEIHHARLRDIRSTDIKFYSGAHRLPIGFV